MREYLIDVVVTLSIEAESRDAAASEVANFADWITGTVHEQYLPAECFTTPPSERLGTWTVIDNVTVEEPDTVDFEKE